MKLAMFPFFLLLASPLQDRSIEAKIFFTDLMQKPSSEKIDQAMPGLGDLSLLFNERDARAYLDSINHGKKEVADWLYASGIFNEPSVEVYPFTKSDLTEKNGNYKGGGGMYRIADKLKAGVVLYSIRYKNKEGHQITNIFIFYTGKKWVFIPKPWRYFNVS